jgi:flagellar basal body-associated protein FliL
MSFCTKCGRPRSGTAQFCTSCGTSFRAKVSQEPTSAVSEAAQPALPTVAEPLPLFPPSPATAEPAPPQAKSPTMPPPPAAPSPEEPTVYPPPPELAGTGDGPFGGLFGDEARAPASQYARVPPPPTQQQDFGFPGSGQPPYQQADEISQQPPSPSRGKVFLIVAVVIVVLAGGGVGAWATLGGKKHPTAQPTHSARPVTTAPSPPPTTTSPTPTPSSSLVAVAPTVTTQSDEQAVLNFLTSYFTAINNHNYQQYRSLLDAQRQAGLTQAGFDSGYQSTKDSDATLTALAPAGSGIIAASVSFTSNQPASDSPTSTTCTNWNITLYLESQGGSYLIGTPPSSYHAAYSAC